MPRNKANQTMKSGQLTEYNMRIFFFKKHTQNAVGKLVQTIFEKINIDHISGSTA